MPRCCGGQNVWVPVLPLCRGPELFWGNLIQDKRFTNEGKDPYNGKHAVLVTATVVTSVKVAYGPRYVLSASTSQFLLC